MEGNKKMNHQFMDDFCNCDHHHDFCDCDLNHQFPLQRRFPNHEFCTCNHEEGDNRRKGCFRQPKRKLTPLRPLDNKFDRRYEHSRRQDNFKCHVDDDIRVRCDDGKNITITIKIQD